MTVTRREALGMTAAGVGAVTLASRPSIASATSRAALPFAIANLPARKRTALSGTWSYILDPYDVARRKPRLRRTVWKNTIETAETGLIEYEWATSPKMHIPGDWTSAVDELAYYDGPVFFRREFEVSPVPGQRYFLAFEAVNYRAQVWLDGEEIGQHEGGFTPFYIEITGRVAAGKTHSLVVCADSRHDAETLPATDFDWMNFGGITRPVWIVELPDTFIRDHFIRLQGEQICATVTLDGPERAGRMVSVNIRGLGLELTGRTDDTGQADLKGAVPERLRRWQPDDPVRYDVTVTAAGDSTTELIGFRTISTRGRELLLNGKPILVNGICIHEEAIGQTATRVMTEAEARALLLEARALGCNLVRLAHYPHSDITIRLADELGLLVWAEIPVYWEDVAYDSPKTLALARQMMGELVARDRNRASVAVWSVANETPVTPERTVFLQTIISDIREYDPTRLVSAALNKNVDVGGVEEGQSRIIVNDPLGDSLDLIAVNQYEAWYSLRMPDEISQVSFSSAFDKPLIFSEFGADAPFGHRGPKGERWTEDFQAWLYEETLKLVERTPGCIGCTPWLLKDFRSPRRWHGQHQQMWNRKGLISPAGERKLAFEILARFYRSRQTAD